MNRRLLLVSLLGVSACAPMSQHALVKLPGFGGARLGPDALVSFDGARLPMTVWPALGGEPWAVVIALHGMNDYAEAFTLAAPVWAAAGVTTYAYDQRGFGRGAGRGVWGGEGLMVEDLRTACALARARHPKAIIAVVGESMGGAVAIAAFASDRPPDADRLVLMSPAVWGWGEQPLPNNIALWLGAHVAPVERAGAAALAHQQDPRHRQHRDPAQDGARPEPDLRHTHRRRLRPGRPDAGRQDEIGKVRASRPSTSTAPTTRSSRRAPPSARRRQARSGRAQRLLRRRLPHPEPRPARRPRCWRTSLAFLRDPAGPAAVRRAAASRTLQDDAALLRDRPGVEVTVGKG